jgi:hypothetical protein
MIGHFEDANEATKAKEIIEEITNQVLAEERDGTLVIGSPSERYSDDMLDLLGRLNIGSIGARELEQFAYEVAVEVEAERVIVTTDEIDVSAFLKVMFNRGACIEVYSAHDHPDTNYGRGKRKV